jgi:hypothetical protein
MFSARPKIAEAATRVSLFRWPREAARPRCRARPRDRAAADRRVEEGKHDRHDGHDRSIRGEIRTRKIGGNAWLPAFPEVIDRRFRIVNRDAYSGE